MSPRLLFIDTCYCAGIDVLPSEKAKHGWGGAFTLDVAGLFAIYECVCSYMSKITWHVNYCISREIMPIFHSYVSSKISLSLRVHLLHVSSTPPLRSPRSRCWGPGLCVRHRPVF